MKISKLCAKMSVKDYLLMGLLLAVVYLIMNYVLTNLSKRENFQNNDVAPTGNDINMVLFYADWCPHCQKIKPLWNRFTNSMDGESVNGRTVHVMKVHCPDSESVCKANDISGYPTIKCMSNNHTEEFSGERTLSGLRSFVNNFVNAL